MHSKLVHAVLSDSRGNTEKTLGTRRGIVTERGNGRGEIALNASVASKRRRYFAAGGGGEDGLSSLVMLERCCVRSAMNYFMDRARTHLALLLSTRREDLSQAAAPPKVDDHAFFSIACLRSS